MCRSSIAPRNHTHRGDLPPGANTRSGRGGKSKGLPSNKESDNITESFDIPFARQEDGPKESILSTCKLTISVEDWGTGLIDGEQLIDCTADKESPDNLGARHVGGTSTKVCTSGAHSYAMTAQNTMMDDPNQNSLFAVSSQNPGHEELRSR